MELRPLRPNLQAKAIRELNEDPNRIQEAFDHIKKWLRKQPHLNIRNDDQFLIAFFRTCKWNIQMTKEKLDNFYSIKLIATDIFKNRDPFSPEIQKVLNAGMVFPMPKVDNSLDPVLVIYSVKNADVNETPLVETLKLIFMTMEILIREDDDFVVSGMNVLCDHDQCPTIYYLQFTPTLMKDSVKSVQRAYPVRLKSFSIINSLTVFESVFNTVIKPFLNSKLQDRIRVLNHTQGMQLLKEYPKNLLPYEFGGTNGSMKDAAELWKKKVESYKEWFLEDDKYLTNEKLRIDTSKLLDAGIGVDGTFRNLIID